MRPVDLDRFRTASADSEWKEIDGKGVEGEGGKGGNTPPRVAVNNGNDEQNHRMNKQNRVQKACLAAEPIGGGALRSSRCVLLRS